MEKEQLLNSDLLERYVLGSVSPSERRIVERFRMEDAEIADAIAAFEISLEKVALENKITPPTQLKSSIIQSIEGRGFLGSGSILGNLFSAPSRSRIIGLAASFTGGLLLTALLTWPLIRQQRVQLTQNEEIISQLEESCEEVNAFYAMANTPGTIPVLLTTSQIDRTDEALALINPSIETCAIHLRKLPRLDNSRTYQVWADVEGEMINLGVLDYESARRGYASLPFLPNAESLNITIEPNGGSLRPTVSNLVLSGEI